MPVLTVEAVRRVRPKGKRTLISDSGAKGLYLVVETSGTKRWLFRYQHRETGPDGTVRDTQHKHALGLYGDTPPGIPLDSARRMAAEWRERMRTGEYPHLVSAQKRATAQAERERLAAAPTVATLVHQFRDRYLAIHTKRPDARLATAGKWFSREFLATPVAEVRRRHLNALLDEIVTAGHPVAANALARLLGQMFRWAVDEEWIEASPAERLQKGTSHTPRDRVLTDDEIRTLWIGLDRADLRMSSAVRHALRVMLLTGVRAGEIAAARWEHVTLEGKEPLWTIPAIAAKSARVHLVPLSKLAVRELRALHAYTGKTEFLLPAGERLRALERRKERSSPPTDHMEAHALGVAVRRSLGLLKMAPWTPHDLRRTLRTGLSRLGNSAELCEKVIGHAVRNQLIATYDLYDAMPERRSALADWSRLVEKIITTKPRAA